MGKSVFSIGGKLRHLKAKENSLSVEEHPELLMEPKITDDRINEESDMVKEFVSAAIHLYPSYKRAVAFLLKEASTKIMKGET